MACNTAATEEEKSKRGVEFGIHDAVESNDHPGEALISTVLTGTNNYFFWCRLMMVALGAKGKLGFVNGEINALDEHSPNYKKWKRADCMVMCWIFNSLSEEVMKSVIFAETAKDLWDNLALVFCQRNDFVRYKMKREIMSARQGSKSVTVYFSKLCKLWGEFGFLFPETVCKCGVCQIGGGDTVAKNGNGDYCFHMTEKLDQFLKGLDDSFHHVRLQIWAMDPYPNIYRAFNMVFMAEAQMNYRN